MESCWHQQSFPHPLKLLPNMLNMWLYLVTVCSSEITVLYAQEGLLDLHLHLQKFLFAKNTPHPLPAPKHVPDHIQQLHVFLLVLLLLTIRRWWGSGHWNTKEENSISQPSQIAPMQPAVWKGLKKVETELVNIFEVVFMATSEEGPKILSSHRWKQCSHPGVLQLFQTPAVGLNPGRWLERRGLWNICNSWQIEGSPAPGCHRSSRHESRQALHGVLPDKHNSVSFYTT